MKQDSLTRLKLALRHQQAGRMEQAELLYREVLRRDPSHPDALNLLGALELGRGRCESAADWMAKAVQVSPKTALYQNNLGVALKALGRLAEAARCFEKAALLQADFYDAHFNLGVVLAKLGQLDGAIAAYERAVRLNRNPAVWNCLGAACLDRGDLPKAIQCFELALALQPDSADAWYNGGRALEQSGRVEEAIAHYEKRAGLPDPPPALPMQLGCLLQQSGRLQEAEAWYRRALRAQPGAPACNNLATLLEQRFEFQEAERLLREAIRLQPNHENAFANLGSVLLALGRVEEAARAYDQAVSLNPGHVLAHYNRAHARLALGDYEGGWEDYEYRWQWKEFPTRKPKFEQPEWTGDDLNGRTLLVYNEQGLGDTIQFARFLSLAAGRGGRVLFACPEALRASFEGLAGVSQFVGPGERPPAFDVHAPLMSLPRLCGTRYETIPGHAPYLKLPPPSRFPLAPRTTGRPRVGLVWAGGTRFSRDGLRSITAAHFLPLLRAARCDFFSLQTGPKAAELKSLPEGVEIEDIGSRLRDFADTAAVMGQLDLVISTCTSSLHLAGALARPVWGLLAYAPDWRWLPPRDDSPWYPTLRLFRQATPGDWRGVLKRVEHELGIGNRE